MFAVPERAAQGGDMGAQPALLLSAPGARRATISSLPTTSPARPASSASNSSARAPSGNARPSRRSSRRSSDSVKGPNRSSPSISITSLPCQSYDYDHMTWIKRPM